MKNLICLIVLGITTIGHVQSVSIIKDTTYFHHLFEIGKSRVLTKDSLVRAQAELIPQNFADTLKKYDWLLLQNLTKDGHMNNYFGYPPCFRCYYNVIRYDTGVVNHILTGLPNATVQHEELPSEGHFNGVTLRNDTSLLLMTVYKKNTWSGIDYRQFEMRRILSYWNGLLIIDELDYRQIWHPIEMRSVYLRIDKIPQ